MSHTQRGKKKVEIIIIIIMAHAVGIQVKKLRSIRQTCRKREKFSSKDFFFPFSSGRELTAPPFLFCFLFLADAEERQAAHKRRWSCAHSVESIDRLLGAASKLVGHFIKIWKNPTPNSPNQRETQEEIRQWPPESRGSKEGDGGCIMYSLPHFTSHQHIFLSFFYSPLE